MELGDLVTVLNGKRTTLLNERTLAAIERRSERVSESGAVTTDELRPEPRQMRDFHGKDIKHEGIVFL